MSDAAEGPVGPFFVLTFAAAWLAWGAAAAIAGWTAAPEGGLPALSSLLFLLGAITPSLIALLLTYRASGGEGVNALLGRILIVPTRLRWYVLAIGFMAAVKLTAALLHRIIAGGWPAFGDIPVYLMLLGVLVSTPVQAGEEIGWRGYALPRLAARLGLARGSVLLGIVWAVWHLPFFLIPASDNAGQPFWVWVLSVTALSVVLAWVYWRTGGSLLITMLMHAAVNNTTGIVPSPPVDDSFAPGAPLLAWLTAALLWICAGYLLRRMRDVRDVVPHAAPAAQRPV